MARTVRQSKILEIIKKHPIDTQDEIVERLNHEGFIVTQATISRDIKELGLTKVLVENGGYRYTQVESEENKISNKIINLYRESVISLASAGNLIVIKTLPGSANAACVLIDKMGLDEVLGCIAGDDTALVIVKTIEGVALVEKQLNEIVG